MSLGLGNPDVRREHVFWRSFCDLPEVTQGGGQGLDSIQGVLMTRPVLSTAKPVSWDLGSSGQKDQGECLGGRLPPGRWSSTCKTGRGSGG